jgi:hypothetical protein
MMKEKRAEPQYRQITRVLKLMNASLSYTWSAEFMSGT